MGQGARVKRGQWLLLFDNALSPDDVTGWLPGRNGVC